MTAAEILNLIVTAGPIGIGLAFGYVMGIGFNIKSQRRAEEDPQKGTEFKEFKSYFYDFENKMIDRLARLETLIKVYTDRGTK